MENQTEKAYTLRGVQATDIFAMLKIIRKVGIKNFKEAFAAPTENKERGLAILEVIVNRLPECELEVYEFLGKLSNMKPQKIAALKAADFMQMIWDVFDDPNFMDFLKVALRQLD